MPFVIGDELLRALIDRKVIPEETTRCVIDIKVGYLPEIHYTILGDSATVLEVFQDTDIQIMTKE